MNHVNAGVCTFYCEQISLAQYHFYANGSLHKRYFRNYFLKS